MSAIRLVAAILMAQEPDITVTETKGGVEFRRPDESKKWAKLAEGAKLKTGDQVQTGLKSSCRLKIGKDTNVLIRSSSFATISEAWIDKNKVAAEVRLDVGSLYVEVDEKRVGEVDMKVSTPVATASVRGTGMFVYANEFGASVRQTHGVVGARTHSGKDRKLDDASRRADLARPGAGDLAILAGITPAWTPEASDEPSSTAVDQTARDANEFDRNGQGLGPLGAALSTGTNASYYWCAAFFRWQMDFAAGRFTVTPMGRLAEAQNVSPTLSIASVRGTEIFRLQDIGAAGPVWLCTDRISGSRYLWDQNLKVWIKQ